MVKTKTQNGQRADKLPHERSDCTVQALANVTGIPYAEAHSILAAQGRNNGEGHLPRLMQTRKSFEGRFLIHEIRRGETLAQFVRNHWSGSFYVCIFQGGYHVGGKRGRRGHMVAVVNGKVVDNLSKSWLRARVTDAWEFERRLSYTG